MNKADEYAPHSTLFNTLASILSVYELCTLPPLRHSGLQRAYQLVVMEDENTGYQTLGPVSKMFNLVARFHAEGAESLAYKEHMLKRKDFMWIGTEGMMMCGTNGSQLWDTSFITQAMVETGLATEEENKESMIKALEWLDQAQIRGNPKHFEEAYRHTSKGAWGFRLVFAPSIFFLDFDMILFIQHDRARLYRQRLYWRRPEIVYVSPVPSQVRISLSPLSTWLTLCPSYTPNLISKGRMCEAIDVILSLQNPDGGFASYELIRGSSWLEQLNPAEVFG